MSTYTINVTYRTGDSFNTYTTEETLGCAFTSIDYAKAALHSIKEHKKYYDLVENYRSFGRDYRTPESKRELFYEIATHIWFYCEHDIDKLSDEEIDYKLRQGYDWQHHLVVHTGLKRQRIGAFWIGYFEKIQKAEICLDDSDLMVEF